MREYSTEEIRRRVAQFKTEPDGRDLDLAESGAVNADVQLLAEDADLRRLTGVNLCGTGIDNDALTFLQGFRWLRELWLDDTRVDDGGLKHLANLPALVELSLGRTDVCGEGLSFLSGDGARLRMLNLRGARNVTNEGLRHLKGLRLLRILDLSTTIAGDATLEYVASLSNLMQLYLNGTQITDPGLRHLHGLSLMELGLNETRVGDEGIHHLSHMRSLRRVGLHRSKITDDGLKAVAELHALRALRLAYVSGISDRGMEYLARLSSLSFLDLCETGVGDAGLGWLCGLRSLRELNIAATEVTDTFFEKLATSAGEGKHGSRGLGAALVKLVISGTDIGDKGIGALAAMRQLQHLEMEDCRYVTKISPLRTLLPGNGGSLRRLSVFGCQAIPKEAWEHNEPESVLDAAEAGSANAVRGMDAVEDKDFLLEILEAIYHRVEKPVTSQTLIRHLKKNVRPKFKWREAYYKRIRVLIDPLGLVSRSKMVLSLTSKGTATLRQFRPQLFQSSD